MKWLKVGNQQSYILAVLIITVLSLAWAQKTLASSESAVNATIKISVCGNGIAEGGEDCDQSDLNGQSCQGLGYGGGALSCDISCSFDTSGCTSPTPTPTPTPPTSTSEAGSTSTSTTQPTPTPSPSSPTTAGKQATLPGPLQFFDLSGSGKLLPADLFQIVNLWVNDWQQYLKEEMAQINKQPTITSPYKCDLDLDGKCDLADFSVLMYYINR